MSSFIKPSSKRNIAKKKQEESIKPSIRRKSPPRGKKQEEIVKYKKSVKKVRINEPVVEEYKQVFEESIFYNFRRISSNYCVRRHIFCYSGPCCDN